MEKINNKKVYLVLQTIILIYISTIISNDILPYSNDIKNMYIHYFSFQFILENKTIFNIISSIFPMIIVISMYSNDLSNELGKNAAYIFTRSSKRKEWLLNRLARIFVGVIFINIIQFLAAFIYFNMLGFKIINIRECSLVVSKILVLLILTQYTLVVAVNIIAINKDNLIGYVTVNSIYILSVLNLNFIFKKGESFLKYIPFTQYIITIQDTSSIDRSIGYFSHYISRYTFGQALIYEVIVLIVLILLGIREIKRAEFY